MPRSPALVAAFIAAFFTTGAQAQQFMCTEDIGALEKNLLKKYGEIAFVEAKSDRFDVNAIRLYLNPKSGSWTLIARIENSPLFCLVDNGTHLKPVKIKKGVAL